MCNPRQGSDLLWLAEVGCNHSFLLLRRFVAPAVGEKEMVLRVNAVHSAALALHLDEESVVLPVPITGIPLLLGGRDNSQPQQCPACKIALHLTVTDITLVEVMAGSVPWALSCSLQRHPSFLVTATLTCASESLRGSVNVLTTSGGAAVRSCTTMHARSIQQPPVGDPWASRPTLSAPLLSGPARLASWYLGHARVQ